MPLAANVQGCSKDRQNEHAKKKKKKTNGCTRVDLPRGVLRRRLPMDTTTTNGNRQEGSLHSPRQRAVTQHKRESRGKASGRHNGMSRACQLPLFCWVVFMSRAPSHLAAPFPPSPPHHRGVSGDDEEEQQEPRAEWTQFAAGPSSTLRQHFTLLHPSGVGGSGAARLWRLG